MRRRKRNRVSRWRGWWSSMRSSARLQNGSSELRTRMVKVGAGMVGVAMVLVGAGPAWAYRPFVSTDATVADPREIEIEFGAFTLDRTGRENTLTAPSVVVNYGVHERWELVGQFGVQEGSGTEITDPGVFLKGVLKEGVLQGKDGFSVALEAGPLLPSTVKGEGGVGFEGAGILSARLAPATLHLNVGGAVDRSDARPFVTWGLFGELPVPASRRRVSSVNGKTPVREGRRRKDHESPGVEVLRDGCCWIHGSRWVSRRCSRRGSRLEGGRASPREVWPAASRRRVPDRDAAHRPLRHGQGGAREGGLRARLLRRLQAGRGPGYGDGRPRAPRPGSASGDGRALPWRARGDRSAQPPE